MRALLAVSSLALAAAVLLPPRVAAASLDELRQRGQLRVAVYADNAPFSDGGQGVDVEVAKALAERLGLRPEIMTFKDGETVDDDLRNVVWKGHFLRKEAIADVMMHVPVDPFLAAKNDKVRILAPYFRERLVVARNRNVIPQLVTLEVFTRERIGVQFNTVEDHFLLNAYGGALRPQVVHYGSPRDAAAALRSNEIAAVMGRQSHVEAALAGAAGQYAIAPFSAPGLALSGWDMGVAVKAEDEELAVAIDRALAGLRADGTIERLFAAHGLSWAPPSAAPSPPAGAPR